MDPATQDRPDARRDVLTRRIRLLVAATIAYNAVEAIVAVAAGARASSSALVGFGLDSVVEVCSAVAVAWQFSASDRALRESRERASLRIIALSFFALGVFVALDAARSLLGGGQAEHSTSGIALAAVSVVVMPLLSTAKRRAARELGSASAAADSNQTLLCTCLSAVLLVGLLANMTLGWSWADPVVALAIVGVAVNEGIGAWRGDACCAAPSTAPHPAATAACGCRLGCAC
jgi:divalent metal cation (Fe/Co/Zn/Cd) transporter